MEINNRMLFKKGLVSCEFAPIGEDDVTQNYVKGLQNQKTYIENTQADINLEKQKEYVKKIRLSKDDGMFGLFVDGDMVGSSGVQNIKGPGYTTIGIFVFDKNDRGKGYGKILVWASSYLLSQTLGCSQFSAGMKKKNMASFKSFKACGYTILKETEDAYILKITASDLMAPDGIDGVKLA